MCCVSDCACVVCVLVHMYTSFCLHVHGGVWKTWNNPDQCYFCDWNHMQALTCQIIKTPQWNERNLSADMLYNTAIILTCNKSAGYTTN